MAEKFDLKAIRERCDKACQMVSDLCKPKGTAGARDWIMRIPAERDYDPDLVIGDSLQDIPAALSRIEELEAELRELKGEPDEPSGLFCGCEGSSEAVYQPGAEGWRLTAHGKGGAICCCTYVVPTKEDAKRQFERIIAEHNATLSGGGDRES